MKGGGSGAEGGYVGLSEGPIEPSRTRTLAVDRQGTPALLWLWACLLTADPLSAHFSILFIHLFIHPSVHSVCTHCSLCLEHSSSSALGCLHSPFRSQLKQLPREAFQNHLISSRVPPHPLSPTHTLICSLSHPLVNFLPLTYFYLKLYHLILFFQLGYLA